MRLGRLATIGEDLAMEKRARLSSGPGRARRRPKTSTGSGSAGGKQATTPGGKRA